MKLFFYAFTLPLLFVSSTLLATIPNDNCSGAQLLSMPPSPTVACGAGSWRSLGTGLGALYTITNSGANAASKSGQLPVPGCQWAASGNKDAWFKVQIPAGADGLDIEWENNGGCSGFLCNTDLNVAAYNAGQTGNCQNLVFLNCESNKRLNLQAPGRPGDWIYLRAWERDDQGFQISFPSIRAYANACDVCSTALELPFTQQFSCGQASQAESALIVPILRSEGAHASPTGGLLLSGDCRGGSDPRDIWLSVLLPAETGGVEIRFENLGGCVDGTALNLCETDVAYAWYTSSTGDCGGLEFRGCDKVNCFLGCTDGKIRVDGRPGERVYVRIWEEQDQGFDIEIKGLTPTAPADRCYTALPLRGLGCNHEATAPQTGTYAEPDRWGAQAHTGTNYCDPPTNSQLWATNENTVWYTFTHPSSSPLDLELINVACMGSGITPTFQMGVFSNAGGPNAPTCNLDLETGYGCAVGNDTVHLYIPLLPAGEYILLVDGMGGNQCFFEFRGTDVLPVDMVYFEGWEQAGQVVLEWANSNEINNAGFEVMRSPDGERYSPMDFVPALNAPNTPEGQYQYRYLDPTVNPGETFYYRLRQLDYDGRFTMSQVVEVQIPEISQEVLLQPLAPNPARESSKLNFFLKESQPLSLDLMDIHGRQVRSFLQNRYYEKGSQELVLSLSGIPEGMYFLRFQASGYFQTLRLVVGK